MTIEAVSGQPSGEDKRRQRLFHVTRHTLDSLGRLPMTRPDEELWTDIARVVVASEGFPRKNRIDRLWRLVLAYRRSGFNNVSVNTHGAVRANGVIKPSNIVDLPAKAPARSVEA